MIIIDTVRLWIDKGKWSWNGKPNDWKDIKKELFSKAEKWRGESSRLIGEAHDKATGWHIRMYNPGRLYIRGSVSHLVNGSDFTRPTDEKSVDRVEEYIKSLKSNLGLNFYIDDLRLGRLDIARNYQPRLGPESLISQIGRLGTVQSLKQQVDPLFYGKSYVRWANTQRELVFYQKGQGWVRSEYRMMKPAVCEKNNFRELDDLRNTGLLRETWKKANQQIIRQARREGIYTEKIDLHWGMAAKIATMLRTSKVYVTKFFEIICRPGLEAFLKEIGGENHIGCWVSSLGILPYRKKRFLDHLEEVLRNSDIPTNTWSDIWQEFNQWVDSARDNTNMKEFENEKDII